MGAPSIQLTNKKLLAGPLREPKYEIADAVDPAHRDDASAWSSCTSFRSLTLTTSLFLDSPRQSSNGETAVDSDAQSQLKLAQIGPLKLALRRCPEAAAR